MQQLEAAGTVLVEAEKFFDSTSYHSSETLSFSHMFSCELRMQINRQISYSVIYEKHLTH